METVMATNGESLRDQNLRSARILALLQAVACIEGVIDKAFEPVDLDLIFSPGLSRRLSRKTQRLHLGRRDALRLIDQTAKHARADSQACLDWLVCELELSLTTHPSALVRYITLRRGIIPRDQETALLYRAISATAFIPERKILVQCLTETISTREPSSENKFKGDGLSEFLTPDQAKILERLFDLADTYFSYAKESGVRPRLFPLIEGPTGSGKNFMAQRLAKKVGAEFLSFTLGDWVPAGAHSDYENTFYAILSKVANHDRVVLCIDEIDKVRLDLDSSWARSVTSDLWRVLDLTLPIPSFLKNARAMAHTVDISEERLHAKVRQSLWIIGLGTWQAQHDARPAVGFHGSSAKAGQLSVKALRESHTIPAELLLRFHPTVLHATYPSREETRQLFDSCGLTSAAENAGFPLNPSSHDWTLGGMRSLEALWAEVAILDRKKHLKTILQ